MKQVLLILTLCGVGLLATTANGQDWVYLENGGISTGGVWNNLGADFNPKDTGLWIKGEETEPTEPLTVTHTIRDGTFEANCLGLAFFQDTTSTVTVDYATVNINTNRNGMLWVGRYGRGTLLIQNGGKVNVKNGAFVGYTGAGEGTIIVTGTNSELNITGRNALWLGGHSVGGNTGYGKSGALNVLDGGKISISQGLHIADKTGTGTVLVDDGTLTVSNSLFVGRNSNDTANTAGKATFTLNSGTVSVTSGDVLIGNGEVNLNGGTFTVKGNVKVYSGGALKMGTGARLGLGAGTNQLGDLTINGGIIDLAIRSASDYSQLTVNSITSDNYGFLNPIFGSGMNPYDFTYEIFTTTPTGLPTDFDWDLLLAPDFRYEWNLVPQGAGLALRADPNAIPEPATWLLLALAFFYFLRKARR